MKIDNKVHAIFDFPMLEMSGLKNDFVCDVDTLVMNVCLICSHARSTLRFYSQLSKLCFGVSCNFS